MGHHARMTSGSVPVVVQPQQHCSDHSKHAKPKHDSVLGLDWGYIGIISGLQFPHYPQTQHATAVPARQQATAAGEKSTTYTTWERHKWGSLALGSLFGQIQDMLCASAGGTRFCPFAGPSASSAACAPPSPSALPALSFLLQQLRLCRATCAAWPRLRYFPPVCTVCARVGSASSAGGRFRWYGPWQTPCPTNEMRGVPDSCQGLLPTLRPSHTSKQQAFFN